MKFITEKIEAGILDLAKLETGMLIEWIETAEQIDKDRLGDEICYRETSMVLDTIGGERRNLV